MKATDQQRPHWALVLCALLVALVATAACGGALGPAPANRTPRPNSAAARITDFRASVQVNSDAPATQVSASCPGDTQMIGGGFSATDVFEYDALVTASYPDPHDSDLRTWTAIAGPSAAFTLTVEVYCLNQGPDLFISLHIEPAGQPAVCPSASAMLGSGFKDGSSYFLCSGMHATSSGVTSASFDPHSSSHSYYPGSLTLTCHSGALAIGGVISQGSGRLLSSFSAGSPYLGWIFVIGGDGAMTVTTTCADIQE